MNDIGFPYHYQMDWSAQTILFNGLFTCISYNELNLDVTGACGTQVWLPLIYKWNCGVVYLTVWSRILMKRMGTIHAGNNNYQRLLNLEFIRVSDKCWHNTHSVLHPLQQHTVYPKKYAHGFVVLCFVVVMQSFIMNSPEVFIHIHQGCFAGTGAIVRLPQCQWSKPGGYGKISQCITTTKHSKAKTVCIFLGIYCTITTTMCHKYPERWLSHCRKECRDVSWSFVSHFTWTYALLSPAWFTDTLLYHGSIKHLRYGEMNEVYGNWVFKCD